MEHTIEQIQNDIMNRMQQFDFPAGTTIVYEGVQLVKDGMQIKADTIPFEDVRKELKLNMLQR